MCFYFYNTVVCETKVTKTLSIKCIIQFVNTLNKKHFYVWSIDSVHVMYVTLMTVSKQTFFTADILTYHSRNRNTCAFPAAACQISPVKKLLAPFLSG